jgi:hemerythrin-like domain-containing protein
MSIRQFLSIGLDFCHHLETHHMIEERYFFPELAVKMPLFRQRDHLLSQHAQIHAGLEGFEKYLMDCRRGERELRMEEMKELMDKFGKVLWAHLDDEVEQLGAENMRKFWTREEMDRIGGGW